MATNKISDDELRQELQSFGINVGPVTDSTRPLLLKKLQKLQKERKGSARQQPSRKNTASSQVKRRQSPSRKLLGFSSDEDEEKSSPRSRRRVSSGRKVTVRKEEENDDEDDVDASRDERSSRSRNQANNSSSHYDDSPNAREEFSDSDLYTGPFQRGSFRFRSFRRKRESPESSKITREGQDSSYPDERTDDEASDVTDGVDKAHLERTTLSSVFNGVAFVIVFICAILLVGYYLDVFPVDNLKYGITSKSGSLPFCTNGKKTDCLDKIAIQEGCTYFLYDILSKHSGEYDCGSHESTSSRQISKEELVKTLDTKITKDFPSWDQPLKKKMSDNVFKLLSTEPGIKCYDKNGTKLDCNSSTSQSVHWFEAVKPYKSLVCRIQQSFSRVMMLMFVLACVFLVLLGVYFGVRNHWRKEEEDTRLMYKFVENIIDILRKHHESCKTDKDLPPYLPIPHVRDMLIKPANRKVLSGVWNRAVRFLSANESRIRVESQRIAGEDFEVWRWIHIMSPKHHSHKETLQDTKRPKCWQGQAFENFQWTVNPPVVSPTPCLKIRNMFDPDVELDDGWHVIIQDAILEKCNDAGANIVHISVDMSSSEGLVYVKCDSQKSAGVAFKTLHGSWFDGRLVAVKYLTLRRYHQRFPKALTATGSLKPSGTSPTSLVTMDPEEDVEVNDSETEV